VYGKKQWQLLPPLAYFGPEDIVVYTETDSYVGFRPAAATADVAEIKHPIEPFACTQRAGEVLFVPTGWSHAVLNVEDSIGVAVEVRSPYRMCTATG
jgi:histone arginine demethylase JMJD6